MFLVFCYFLIPTSPFDVLDVHRVLVLGVAGCGKSTLVSSFKSQLEEQRSGYQSGGSGNSPKSRSSDGRGDSKKGLVLHFGEMEINPGLEVDQSDLSFYKPDAYLVMYSVSDRCVVTLTCIINLCTPFYSVYPYIFSCEKAINPLYLLFLQRVLWNSRLYAHSNTKVGRRRCQACNFGGKQNGLSEIKVCFKARCVFLSVTYSFTQYFVCVCVCVLCVPTPTLSLSLSLSLFHKVSLTHFHLISASVLTEGRQTAINCNCKYIETSCTISLNIDFLLAGIGAQINLRSSGKRKGTLYSVFSSLVSPSNLSEFFLLHSFSFLSLLSFSSSSFQVQRRNQAYSEDCWTKQYYTSRGLVIT